MSDSEPTKFGSAFKKLWSASAVSNLADGLLRTSAPLLATTLTKDPFLISALGALIMLPWLLFAIPIGGLVDRANRRQLLALANLVRFGAIGLLAISIGFEFISLPILFLATFLFGVGEVLYDTTIQSMIPQVLGKDQLDRGNAQLQVTSVTLGELFGAPLGGILFAVSIGLPFFFGALGVGVAVLLVMTIPRHYSIHTQPDAPLREKTGYWVDIRFGVRYLYEHKVLLTLVLLTSSLGFFYAGATSTLVLFVTETLEAPIAIFGFLFSAGALGALVGALIAPKLSKRFGRSQVLALAIVIAGALILAQGLSPNYLVFTAISAAGSLVITVWNILLMSIYHQMIPTELFGRIHGTRRTLVWGLMPIGSLLGGLVASIDLRLPFLVGGAISLVVALAGYRFVRGLSSHTQTD
jgi:MFS family permease